MQLNWVFLLVASLASLAACQGGPLTGPLRKPARFIDPPPYGLLDDGLFKDFSNNKRYRHGESVRVKLSPGGGTVEGVSAVQLNTAENNIGPKRSWLFSAKKANTYVWTAEYDINHYSKNGEDAVYRFEFESIESNRIPGAIMSAYINVSMPDSSKKSRPAPSRTTSLVRESPTSQSTKRPQPDSTTTAKSSRKTPKPPKNRKNGKNGKPSKKSGLTGPQVAGITIGAVAGFVLMLLGFCWGYNRMRVARQLQKSHEFELRNMEREVRTLKDTVSKLGS